MLIATTAAPARGQIHLASAEELRRELATGDVVTVVPAGGQPIDGRITRIGAADLELRQSRRSTLADSVARLTIPFERIKTLERRRDSTRNGAALGAAIGAAAAGSLFVYALAVDRNEVDEWAPTYAGMAAASAGIGALIGWAVDRARSKRHIRFEAAAVVSLPRPCPSTSSNARSPAPDR
jgi:hypothetical protein